MIGGGRMGWDGCRVGWSDVMRWGYLCWVWGTGRVGDRVSRLTETDLRKYRNGLLWVPKRTRTDFSGYRNGPEQTSSYRNELQWEPEKVGWGTIGTILTKLCMYWLVGS